MQINQAPEASAANRARIDRDRLVAIQREEKRLFRAEQRLAACRTPEARARALRRVASAKRRIEYVRIHGSRPAKGHPDRKTWAK